MPDQCDPCICTDMYIQGRDAWRKAVLTLLCRLNDTLLGGVASAGNAVLSTMTVIPAASITAGYTLAVDLPDDTRQVRFDNQTDGEVKVSMDAGAHDTYLVAPGQVFTENFYALGRVTSAITHVKRGGTTPTQGNFLIYAIG